MPIPTARAMESLRLRAFVYLRWQRAGCIDGETAERLLSDDAAAVDCPVDAGELLASVAAGGLSVLPQGGRSPPPLPGHDGPHYHLGMGQRGR